MTLWLKWIMRFHDSSGLEIIIPAKDAVRCSTQTCSTILIFSAEINSVRGIWRRTVIPLAIGRMVVAMRYGRFRSMMEASIVTGRWRSLAQNDSQHWRNSRKSE
jgi:hypothetical protein